MSTEDVSRQNTVTKEANQITNEHIMKLEELCSVLQTDCFEGLNENHAKQLLKSHGYNIYSKPKQPRSGSFRKRIFPGKKSKDQWSKHDWNRVFNTHVDDLYTVIRSGVKQLVKRSHLLPGDLCMLEGWQIVPADMRVISYEGELVVDNRIVTGNTQELKSNSPTSHDFLLSQNVLFACTELLSGTCEAIILRTGNDTVFSELIQFAQKVKLVNNRGKRSSLASSTSTGSSLNDISGSSTPEQQEEEDLQTPPPSPTNV